MNQERSSLLVIKRDWLREERNWKGKRRGLTCQGLFALPPVLMIMSRLLNVSTCLRFRWDGIVTKHILDNIEVGWVGGQAVDRRGRPTTRVGWDRWELRRVNFRCVSCAVSDCIALHELS